MHPNDGSQMLPSDSEIFGSSWNCHSREVQGGLPPVKQNLPFGDDDSKRESDFEDERPAKKSKASSAATASGSERKAQRDAVKPAMTKPPSTKIFKQPSALKNGKAGCYQKTVVHLLSSIPAFAAFDIDTSLENAKADIAPAFGKMMRLMLNNSSGAEIDTADFKEACGHEEVLSEVFDGKTQQDADEFFGKLIA